MRYPASETLSGVIAHRVAIFILVFLGQRGVLPDHWVMPKAVAPLLGGYPTIPYSLLDPAVVLGLGKPLEVMGDMAFDPISAATSA
jgi:hypothetical protein